MDTLILETIIVLMEANPKLTEAEAFEEAIKTLEGDLHARTLEELKLQAEPINW